MGMWSSTTRPLLPATAAFITNQSWLGNVRELREVLRQAHAHCQSGTIEPDDLPARIKGELGGASSTPQAMPEFVDLDQILHTTERTLIERAIKQARGNKTHAAELLNISRPSLYRRMQLLGIGDGTGMPPTC